MSQQLPALQAIIRSIHLEDARGIGGIGGAGSGSGGNGLVGGGSGGTEAGVGCGDGPGSGGGGRSGRSIIRETDFIPDLTGQVHRDHHTHDQFAAIMAQFDQLRRSMAAW